MFHRSLLFLKAFSPPDVAPPTSVDYKSLLQTWQRLTLVRSRPPFKVSCCGGEPNCCLGSTVVSQKLYLLAKKWQVPLAPLHSMNGVARKSSRQEPGDTRD